MKRELFPGRRSYYRGEWRDAQRILDRHIHSRSSLFERCEKPREDSGNFFSSLFLSFSFSPFLTTKKIFHLSRSCSFHTPFRAFIQRRISGDCISSSESVDFREEMVESITRAPQPHDNGRFQKKNKYHEPYIWQADKRKLVCKN